MDKELIPYNTGITPYATRTLLEEAQKEARRIRRVLTKPTPQDYIQRRDGPVNPRTGQRMKLAYVQWGYCVKVLNLAFDGNWSHEVVEVQDRPLPDVPGRKAQGRNPASDPKARIEVMVRIKLTTPFGTHEAVAGHTYYPASPDGLYADAYQSAKSKALTRAAAYMGIGLDLKLREPEVEVLEMPDEAADALAAWRFACGKHGLSEIQAVALMSTHLTGDMNSLPTLADILEQYDNDFARLIEALGEAVATALDGDAIEGEFVEVPA